MLQYKKLVFKHHNPKNLWKALMSTKQIQVHTHPKVSTGKKSGGKKKTFYYVTNKYTLIVTHSFCILTIVVKVFRPKICEIFCRVFFDSFTIIGSRGNEGVRLLNSFHE